jgi:hypothetical protein
MNRFIDGYYIINLLLILGFFVLRVTIWDDLEIKNKGTE